jgi:hypothetical protein
MPEKRPGKEILFLLKCIYKVFFLGGSVATLNAVKKDKQYSQSPSANSVPDFDPFSLRNSTKEFRTRCDKVCGI